VTVGYHYDLQAELESLASSIIEPAPVLAALEVTEAQFDRLAVAVFIIRESISFEPFRQINPTPGAIDQPETWTWALYVIGGGGGRRPSDRGGSVDLLLEQLREGLSAQRLSTRCGPLQLIDETYEGPHGTGVMYVQRWRHSRLPCRED
jgi:hypothetical protein